MKQDYKNNIRLFYRLYCSGDCQQLCSAVIRDISENIPDSTDEDHTAYHNQFCDTASDRSAFGRVH